MSTMRRLLKLIRPYIREVMLAVLLGAATMLSNVALIATSAYLISMAALQPSIASLQVAIVGVRFFGITRGVFRYLERLTSHGLNLRILGRFHVWFYQAIEPLAPAALSKHSSGDLLSRVVGDVDALKDFYVRVLAPPLVAVVTVAVWGLYVGFLDGPIFLALLAAYLLVGVALPWFIQRLQSLTAARAVRLHQQLSELWVSGIQGMADVLVYNRQQDNKLRLQQVIEGVSQVQLRQAAVSALRSSLSTLLANGSMWLVLLLAIPLVSSGHLPGVMLAVVVLGSLASFEAIFPLPLAAEHLRSNLESASRVFEIIDSPPLVVEPIEPHNIPSNLSLEIEALKFTYPDMQGPVLKDIGLSLTEGKKVAVVGPSGAGKTTLINLILRYWPLQQGEIRLNGKPLAAYDGDALRKNLAVISQHTYLFGASVRDNLLLAHPKATETQLEQALRLASLQDFIAQLPEGLDTWVGEHGRQFSAGQRQRMALSRAFLRDAPLVLLDEPTVNLDPLTEAEILASVFDWAKARSMLLVTHRLVGLENMDEIIVLQHGRVCQCGTQHELLSQKGLYRSMWETQNQYLNLS